MNALGKHFIVEYYGCDPKLISYRDSVESVLLNAVRIANANIVTSSFHNFKPYGVSGVIIISESHFSIHTWPEHRYAGLDIFTCSETVNERAAIDYIGTSFKAKNVKVNELERGLLSEAEQSEKVSLETKIKNYR